MIDLTATDLTAKTATELRKIGAEAGVKGASKSKKSDLLVALLPIQDAQRAERDAKISQDYAPRTGTSRAGLKMNTKNGQTGTEKATLVISALGAGFATSIVSGDGIVILKVASEFGHGAKIVWATDGAYQYGPSTVTVKGKARKVRNVAELLRTLL